jgi:hypothetical protein
MNSNFNCILIDLTRFKSRSEIKEFLISCNLQEKISERRLWGYKKGVFTKSEPVYKVWFDAKTFAEIGYSTVNEQNFTLEFINFLQEMTPIEEGEKFEFQDEVEELTMDNILDKINKFGLNSLSNTEKDFLESF